MDRKHQPPQTNRKLIATGVALLLGGLALSGWLLSRGLTQYQQVTQTMQQKGWGKYLKTPNKNAVAFSLKCNFNDACRKTLNAATKNTLTGKALSPGLGLMGIGLVSLMAARPRRVRKSPGYAYWGDAKNEKISRYIKNPDPLNTNTGYLGILETGEVLRPPMRDWCTNVLIVGGVGAGKTSGLFRPMLMFDAIDGNSSIVYDLKYPDKSLFEMVIPFARYGRRVQVFTPFSPNTMRLPLLEDVKDKESALMVANIIRPPSSSEGDVEYYKNLERILLASTILGVMTDPYSGKSLKDVYLRFCDGQKALTSFLVNHDNRDVKQMSQSVLALKEETLVGLINGLIPLLQIFDDPNLSRATTSAPGENLQLKSVFTLPTILYIGIPQRVILNGAAGRMLLQLIKRTINNKMLEVAEFYGGQLPVLCTEYDDEFHNFGFIPDNDKYVSTNRSRRMAMVFGIQNLSQGEYTYGDRGFAAMTNNVIRHMIAFPGAINMKDARTVSDSLGRITAYDVRNGRSSGGLFETRTSQNEGEVARPLLGPEEFSDFGDNRGILMSTGMPPVKVYFPKLTDPEMAGVKNPLYHPFKQVMDTVTDVEAEIHKIVQQYNKIPTPTVAQILEREDPSGLLNSFVSRVIRYGAAITVTRTLEGRLKDLVIDLETVHEGQAKEELMDLMAAQTARGLPEPEDLTELEEQDVESFIRKTRYTMLETAGLLDRKGKMAHLSEQGMRTLGKERVQELEELQFLGLLEVWKRTKPELIPSGTTTRSDVIALERDATYELPKQTVQLLLKMELPDELMPELTHSRLLKTKVLSVPKERTAFHKVMLDLQSRKKGTDMKNDPQKGKGNDKTIKKGRPGDKPLFRDDPPGGDDAAGGVSA